MMFYRHPCTPTTIGRSGKIRFSVEIIDDLEDGSTSDDDNNSMDDEDCSIVLDDAISACGSMGNIHQHIRHPVSQESSDKGFELDNSEEWDDLLLSEAYHYQPNMIVISQSVRSTALKEGDEESIAMATEEDLDLDGDEERVDLESFTRICRPSLREMLKQSSSRRLLMESARQSSSRRLIFGSSFHNSSTRFLVSQNKRLLDFEDEEEEALAEDDSLLLSYSVPGISKAPANFSQRSLLPEEDSTFLYTSAQHVNSLTQSNHSPGDGSLLMFSKSSSADDLALSGHELSSGSRTRQSLMVRQSSSKRSLVELRSTSMRPLLSRQSSSRRRIFSSAKQSSCRRMQLNRTPSAHRMLTRPQSASRQMLPGSLR